MSQFGLRALHENSPDTFVLRCIGVILQHKACCAGARAYEKRSMRLLGSKTLKILKIFFLKYQVELNCVFWSYSRVENESKYGGVPYSF